MQKCYFCISMKKVIYTALTGNYDRLVQPEVTDPSYDYICFTERDGQDGIWQLRRIAIDSPDPVTRARFTKLQPHTALPDYDFSVFMDANLCITGRGFYDKVEAAIEAGASFAGLEHPQRDCVYDELRYCFLKEKIGTRAAFRHLRYLKSIGQPKHAGLMENNILLRAHNDPVVVDLDNAWWDLFLHCCTRDQLSLPPALFLQGVVPSLLLGEGLNARNVPYIRYSMHPRSRRENIPGRINAANLIYNLRLAWRKFLLLWMR